MEKGNPKLTPKQEAYTILRSAGKPIREAYVLAGYEGKPETKAHHALERKIKSLTLVAPDMLKTGHNVAKLTLKIAEKVLKDKEKRILSNKEEICLKKAHELYIEQQKRESPVINRNVNLNVDIHSEELVDLSAYRDDPASGEEKIEQAVSVQVT